MIKDMSKFPPFQYGTEPYKHQDDDFKASRDREYYGLFWEMGTGKSKPLVDTAAWLFLKQEIDGVLIVSDKGAYLNWYYEEVPKHMPKGIPYRMAYWSSYMRTPEIRKMDEVMVAQDDMLDILCVNIEALSSSRAFEEAKRFIQNHYVMMIVDESTSIKNHKAERTKAAMQLGALCDYRRIATGTPITQSPLDLFAQCQFLKPGCLQFASYTAFKAFYAQTIIMRMGTRSFPKVVGYHNLSTMTRIIQNFSSRRLKTECVDLPAKVYETIYVEHSPDQEMAYNNLREMALLNFDQGLLTTTTALALINKLQQINCGHVKLDDGTVRYFTNNRLTILIELLKKIDGKVIIWCAFQEDVYLIMSAIAEQFTDYRYAVHYYGKTSDDDRKAAITKFRTDDNCRWWVGTAATGGKALTLVESHYTVYYSNSYNLEDRLQSEDRNHRIGQTKQVTYFDLVCPRTVDVRILKNLRDKKDLASQVLDTFRELLTESVPF